MPYLPNRSPRRPWQPKPKAFHNMIQRTGFYANAAWRRLRLAKLRINPMCERCIEKNKSVPASLVHHIHPVNPDNPYDTQQGKYGEPLLITNLESLCSQCHNSEMGSK